MIWIIDFDVINSETNKTPKGTKTALQEFREYRQEIDRDHENILIIINNPCLEYWFLLHFEKTSKYFSTCEEAGKQLKKHLPDYEKTQRFYTKESNDIYLKLKPHLDKAITNANSLDEFDINNPKKGITEMQKLFVMNGIKQSFPALTTGERKTNS